MSWLTIGGAAVNVVGGLFQNKGVDKQLGRGRSDILNLPGMSGPTGIGGNFGQVGANGQFMMDPTMGGTQLALGGMAPGLLGGGLFNQQNFQNAFQNNDMLGALNQANQGFSQQAGGSAFGNLGGLNSMLGQQTMGGPQDYFGGMGGQLMGQGMQNMLNAGNQQGLFNQSLGMQRQAALPEFQRQQQAMEQSLFNKGMFGQNTTQTGEGYRGLFEAQGAQDLAFQNNAFGQMMQQQNFLGNLGNQQMGQGFGMGQANLGQFNQNIGNMMGLEGQGFGQALQGMGFNSNQGLQRLNAAQGLFGLGNESFAQNVGLGQSAANNLLGFGQFGLQAARSPQELQASLISGSGLQAQGLADIATSRASSTGGFLGGITNAIGGLFSDLRLKSNIKRIGEVEPGIGWYSWDWNDTAKSLGITDDTEGVIAQEVLLVHPKAVTKDKNGYFKVDYEQIGSV